MDADLRRHDEAGAVRVSIFRAPGINAPRQRLREDMAMRGRRSDPQHDYARIVRTVTRAA
jgi:hypothetical protein